jgi:hypothetical protein
MKIKIKTTLGISLFLIILSSYGESVECTLQSGAEKVSVAVKLSSLEDGQGEFIDEKGVKDLSFDMSVECMEQSSCFIGLTIYSQILEDEATSTGFEFARKAAQEGKVYSEKLTNTPDREAYSLYCHYRR